MLVCVLVLFYSAKVNDLYMTNTQYILLAVQFCEHIYLRIPKALGKREGLQRQTQCVRGTEGI